MKKNKKQIDPKKQNFLEWNNNVLTSSIKKINLNIILIVILDALFYLLSGYLAIFWLQRIQAKMLSFNLPTDVAVLGVERTQQLAAEAKAFYYLVIFSFILLLIAIIFLASIAKGIIWAKTTKTKISFALISKFLGLNLIWMGFWFVSIILISLLVQPASVQTFMLIAIVAGIYFTNTLYTVLMKEQKFESIIKYVKFNFIKIKLLALPYAIFFIFLFVVLSLSALTRLNQAVFSLLMNLYGFIGINAVSQFEIQIILLVSLLVNPLFLLSFAVFRYYVSTLVLEAEKSD